MSKRNFSDDEKVVISTKRVKTKKSDTISSDLLENLQILKTKISSFVSNKHINIPDGKKIVEYLDQASNTIPRIVVFGDQSSGKSSLLKAIIDCDTKISATIGTRCPIIFMFCKKYNKVKYKIYENNAFHNEYETIIAAENEIEKRYGNIIVPSLKIICEIPQEKMCDDIIFVDLPGYNIDADPGYFNDLRNEYLDKPESIILHVVKADTDPKNIHSRTYLNGVKGKLVKVVTHIDAFQTNADKKPYLDAYRAESEDGILCLTIPSNKEKENEIINSHNISNDKDQIGSENTKSYIIEKLIERTIARLPEILDSLSTINKLIDSTLNNIRRVPPDMRDCMNTFKRNYDRGLTTATSDGGWITTTCKNISNLIENGNYDNLTSNIPDVGSIQRKIESGSSLTLRGTEGYGHVIDIIMKDMFNKLIPYLSQTIDTSFAIFTDEYKNNQTLTSIYDKEALQVMFRYVNEKAECIKSKVQKDVKDYINEKKNNLFCNDSHVYRTQVERQTKEDLMSLIKQIRECRNIATAISSDETCESIMHKVLNDKMKNDPYSYRVKAISAREFSTELWNSECNRIEQYIVQKIRKYILTDLVEGIKQTSWGLDVSHFKENSEIDSCRKQLQEIESLINDIIVSCT